MPLRRLDFQPFCAGSLAGSLVCPIVFSTNQRLACTNRAGKSLIGQFSLVNNKDSGYLRGGIFCCLLNDLKSLNFLAVQNWKIHQKALGNLFNGKDVFLTQPARSGKSIFSVVLSDCLS